MRTKNTSAPGGRTRSIHAFSVCLAVLIHFCAQTTYADQAVFLAAGGTPAEYPDVVLHGVARNPDGSLVFQMARKPGDPAVPIPAASIQSLAIGDNGEGRSFDITLADENTGGTFHPATTVLAYDGTQFTAIPSGGTQAFPIDAARIQRIVAPALNLSDNNTPPSQPQFAPPVVSATPPISAGQDEWDGSFDDSDFTDADYSEVTFSEDLEFDSEFKKAIAALGALLAVVVVWALLIIASNIMIAVWCFKNDQVMAGIAILMCCTIWKAALVFGKYDGPWKLPLQILTALELISVIGSRVIDLTG